MLTINEETFLKELSEKNIRLEDIHKRLVEKLKTLHLKVATAESCTGGLISQKITALSGSSSVFDCGVCSYSNEIKTKVLGVDKHTLDTLGAVSAEVAMQMSYGVRKLSESDVAISTTGIAGPTGGTKEKPVGLCYIGIANKDKIVVKKVLMPSFLPRRFMKFCFAKKALYYLKEFLEG